MLLNNFFLIEVARILNYSRNATLTSLYMLIKTMGVNVLCFDDVLMSLLFWPILNILIIYNVMKYRKILIKYNNMLGIFR